MNSEKYQEKNLLLYFFSKKLTIKKNDDKNHLICFK